MLRVLGATSATIQPKMIFKISSKISTVMVRMPAVVEKIEERMEAIPSTTSPNTATTSSTQLLEGAAEGGGAFTTVIVGTFCASVPE